MLSECSSLYNGTCTETYKLCVYINTLQWYRLTSTVIYIVRGIAIGADALVLIMTWIKTYSIYVSARRAKIGTGIPQLLLRDGMYYLSF